MNRKLIARSAAAIVATGTLLGTTVGFTGSAAAAAPSWPILKSGSHGVNVKALQYLLTCSPQVGSDKADGIYGKKTKRLVKQYERDVDLVKPDGIVGPKTWSSLTSNRPFRSQIRLGDRGACVRAAQVLLKKQGYKVKLDGTFGKDTHKAAVRFESARKLPVDGIIGVRTWSKLIRFKN